MSSRPLLVVALGCFSALFFVCLAAGCDSSGDATGGGDPLTCEWLEGANCWKAALAEAKACTTEGSVEQGAMDFGTGVCTYADGATVTFAGLSDPFDPNTDVWDATVTDAGGAFCARFVEADEGMTLTTASGSVSVSTSGDRYDLTCPDGTTRSTPQLSLFSCDLSHAPGRASSGSPTWISLSMIGGGEAQTAVNISCKSN